MIEIKKRPRYHRLVHPSSILLRPYLSLAMHALFDSLKSRFDAARKARALLPD